MTRHHAELIGWFCCGVYLGVTVALWFVDTHGLT